MSKIIGTLFFKLALPLKFVEATLITQFKYYTFGLVFRLQERHVVNYKKLYA